MRRAGRPVAPCAGCGRRLLDADLQRGRAFRFAGGLLDLACAFRLPGFLSLEQRDFLRKIGLRRARSISGV